MRAWEEFLDEQEGQLGKKTVEQWLRPLKVVRFDACNLYLEAPDSFKAVWFDEHVRPTLQPNFTNSNNKKIKIHISVANQVENPDDESKKRGFKGHASSLQRKFVLEFDDINPQQLFENFVQSEGNILAFKLLCEVCGICFKTFKPLENRALAPPFNPIYLTGRSGSGKTHLMMATANALTNLGLRAVYIRAETFTEHVVEAIRCGEMQTFRKSYRFIDVLLVDDIEIFSRKLATQEEFFHTFNALHLEGKQIILGSSYAPKELKFIEPRLVSRFEWGIVVPMRHLDATHMKSILEQKALKAHFPLENSVSDFLIETFNSNSKHLLRSLDALILRTHLNQGLKGSVSLPLGLESVKQQIQDLILEEEKASLTPGKVIRTVAAHYGISTNDILGKSQNRECALPRQMAMYICREQLKLPFMKIGDLFGRDHSTVMTSAKQIQKSLTQKNQDIASALTSITKRLEIPL